MCNWYCPMAKAQHLTVFTCAADLNVEHLFWSPRLIAWRFQPFSSKFPKLSQAPLAKAEQLNRTTKDESQKTKRMRVKRLMCSEKPRRTAEVDVIFISSSHMNLFSKCFLAALRQSCICITSSLLRCEKLWFLTLNNSVKPPPLKKDCHLQSHCMHTTFINDAEFGRK